MSNAIEFVSTNPAIAFIVMTFHLAISISMYELQLPIIVIQIFQIAACSVTITIGAITLYKFLKAKK